MQLSAEPVFVSPVQELPSLQSAGQSPSQVSPASVVPLPQLIEQSLSVVESQPAGQQPSAPAQTSMEVWVQAARQVPSPPRTSLVQTLPSWHSVGQALRSPTGAAVSQVSPASRVPFPQDSGSAQPSSILPSQSLS